MIRTLELSAHSSKTTLAASRVINFKVAGKEEIRLKCHKGVSNILCSCVPVILLGFLRHDNYEMHIKIVAYRLLATACCIAI